MYDFLTEKKNFLYRIEFKDHFQRNQEMIYLKKAEFALNRTNPTQMKITKVNAACILVSTHSSFTSSFYYVAFGSYILQISSSSAKKLADEDRKDF